MKVCLVFSCPEPVTLPISYNHILQAALLAWLQDKEYTTFLHDTGYQRERRTFKLYSFSKLLGTHTVNRKTGKITFRDTVCVYLSSYMEEMEQFVIKSLDEERPLRLGNVLLPLEEAYFVDDLYEACFVQAVSPITIHSTFQLPTGTKKTYYYQPTEKDFSIMLRDNLIRKYKAVYEKEPENTEFSLEPLKDGSLQKEVVKYRETIIEGWTGRFFMSGSPELIQMALLAGVGARNSMGFGCLVQIEKM